MKSPGDPVEDTPATTTSFVLLLPQPLLFDDAHDNPPFRTYLH